LTGNSLIFVTDSFSQEKITSCYRALHADHLYAIKAVH